MCYVEENATEKFAVVDAASDGVYVYYAICDLCYYDTLFYDV